ncbi:hypothetical protein DSO57_1023277 [Entomophthora muscae]|uniref:Uncharacterized protein n=1 Tax=Entomophthora muscae TaxID=34485 RepID=A0ACC2TQ99_9FUNG|nr:hypothetical protein DSO57_1023277 [Entomophthora muscae]
MEPALTHYVATKITPPSANVFHETQEAFEETLYNVSNGMDQSECNVELRALSPN